MVQNLATSLQWILVEQSSGCYQSPYKILEIKDKIEFPPLDQTIKTSDAETFFNYIAHHISLFVKKHELNDQLLPLGFTFSFPVKQSSLSSGFLIRWTKGFTASGVVNEDVVKLLKEALGREGMVSLLIWRI